jgi:SAM-dependent methyltransferase
LALAKHAPRSGARVLEVGCGRGRTTIDLARLVGPRGSVVGLDACDARLAVARTLLERAGYADIRSNAIDAPLVMGSHLDAVIARQLEEGPSDAELRDVIGELRAALSPFVTSRGGVMPSSAWCITATSPT